MAPCVDQNLFKCGANDGTNGTEYGAEYGTQHGAKFGSTYEHGSVNSSVGTFLWGLSQDLRFSHKTTFEIEIFLASYKQGDMNDGMDHPSSLLIICNFV